MTANVLKYSNQVASTKVTAKKALFIKLGRAGAWEKDCIQQNVLRLGFIEPDFQWCSNGDWEKVKNHYIKLGVVEQTASGYANQIQYFFEEPEDTIWITFYNRKLWWTQAKTEVIEEKDGNKIRSCRSKWFDTDIKGNILSFDKISGKLLATQGYRSTICNVKEKDYLLRKINAEQSEKVRSTNKSYENLQNDLSKLIKELTWQDFETLIDLIFTQAGWKRVSKVGKTAKTLDLDLKSPVTNEKCLVQIKSSSNNNELSKYLKNFRLMDQYHKFYYVCHTFKDVSQKVTDSKVKLWRVDKISELTIDSGLSKWVIDKVS